MSKHYLDPILNQLLQKNLITKQDSESIREVIAQFKFQISPEMEAQIDTKNVATDPIAKQFIPDKAELEHRENESTDPIGDKNHLKVKGIIHRYPDRCLLIPVQVCPVYCRFCFRRESVGTPAETLRLEELSAALAYIQQQKSIWEVILTGGDPLILKPKILATIVKELTQIPHIEVIRIHTRIPLVTPARINSELLASLNTNKAMYIVLHANHVKEFTPSGIKACQAIIQAGIPMLSQTTLLKGVNDNIESLSALMRCFIRNRIKPYYLHHADLAKGTSHFRTSIQEGQSLVKQLRGRFSGLCQPVYVLDIPGGHGKMPIGPTYLIDINEQLQIEDYLGEVHKYPHQN